MDELRSSAQPPAGGEATGDGRIGHGRRRRGRHGCSTEGHDRKAQSLPSVLAPKAMSHVGHGC